MTEQEFRDIEYRRRYKALECMSQNLQDMAHIIVAQNSIIIGAVNSLTDGEVLKDAEVKKRLKEIMVFAENIDRRNKEHCDEVSEAIEMIKRMQDDGK